MKQGNGYIERPKDANGEIIERKGYLQIRKEARVGKGKGSRKKPDQYIWYRQGDTSGWLEYHRRHQVSKG